MERNDIRESIIHGLRSQGWSKIDAEDEADFRIEKWNQETQQMRDADSDD